MNSLIFINKTVLFIKLKFSFQKRRRLTLHYEEIDTGCKYILEYINSFLLLFMEINILLVKL